MDAARSSHPREWRQQATPTLTMTPMRLLSEVKGNICRTQKVRIWPPGVLSCMEVRSLLTRVSPTLSVHCTSATCGNSKTAGH